VIIRVLLLSLLGPISAALVDLVPMTCTTLCSNRVTTHSLRPIALESPYGRLHARWDDELRYLCCGMVV